jgi:ribonuclease G
MKKIFIEDKEDFLRIAVKVNDKLCECLIEESKKEPLQGEIYKGTVKNIVPAIKCAFIDIGYEKNAFLYFSEREVTGIKKGDDVIVEVLKEQLGDKGAKVTTAFTIPGRYCVLLSKDKSLCFSSKIDDINLKQNIIDNIKKPKEVGFMIRTNAMSVSIEEINHEIEELYEIYKQIVSKASYTIKAKLLYGEDGILGRSLRDLVDKNTTEIIVEGTKAYEYVLDFLKDKTDVKPKVTLYNDFRGLFDIYSIEKEILNLRNERVNLPCGGYIIIQKTEAMYVVDVNSGKNVSHSMMGKTIALTNLNAAREIVRQIRLRNLSGIILVDFIDMTDQKVKKEVLDVLNEGFLDDKNKTVVYPFTELNLVQIARRRRGKSIFEFINEACDVCKGHGERLRFEYLCLLIRNEIIKLKNSGNIKNIFIEINNSYEEKIKNDILEFVNKIDAKGDTIYAKFDSEVETFRLEPLIFKNQMRNVENYKIYE